MSFKESGNLDSPIQIQINENSENPIDFNNLSVKNDESTFDIVKEFKLRERINSFRTIKDANQKYYNKVLEMYINGGKKSDGSIPSLLYLFNLALIRRCKETTANGLPYMFKTKNWIVKIFWFIIWHIGIGAGLYCNNKTKIFYYLLKILKKVRQFFFK